MPLSSQLPGEVVRDMAIVGWPPLIRKHAKHKQDTISVERTLQPTCNSDNVSANIYHQEDYSIAVSKQIVMVLVLTSSA